MGTRHGLILRHEHIEVARRLLSDSEAGRLLFALADYSESGNLPDDDQSKVWSACFDLLRKDVDENAKRYAETCQKNRDNIAKRWQSKQDTTVYGRIQSNTNDTNRIEENGTEEKGIELRREEEKCFTPPTLEEVRTYCQVNGIEINADRFVDFNAARGWMAGNTPICDWKAAVRAWAKNERRRAPVASGGKIVEHQQYPQRTYENTYDIADAMMERFLQSEADTEKGGIP